MNVTTASVTFVTPDVSAVREFYDRYFDTWYPFDCGWYVLVRLGRARSGSWSRGRAPAALAAVPC